MALDSNKGFAVITEEASNTIQLVDLTNTGPVLSGGPIAVGKQPTSVAIDDQLALPNYSNADLGVVVNSGDGTLSLLALTPATATVIGTPISLNGLFVNAPGTVTAAAPYAVGVDPSTHLAVVAFSNSNIGFIVDVNPNPHTRTCFSQPSLTNLPTAPPCVVSSVSLNTGPTPQVVMQPNVPLAYVTPGGGGTLSVVNLLQTNTSVSIAAASAAPAGAVRTNNVVTIITTTPHGINPAVGGTVLIAGVSPADLNGTYQVIPGSVTDPFTFQYTQVGTLANESGGGGTVTYGSPYYTFNVTNTVSGGAINPITRTIALADPNATVAQISFIRTLDQSVTSLTLTTGSCNGCTPTPSGAPERSFSSVAWDPYTNLTIAYAPSDNADPNLDGNKISLINPGGPIAGGTQSPYRIVAAVPTNQVGTGSFTPAGASAPVTVSAPMIYDPKTKFVLVANAGSNSLSYLNLDPTNSFKPVEIKRVDVTSGGVPSAQPALGSPIAAGCNPAGYTGPYMQQGVMIGCPSVLRIFGQGFSGAKAQVRLDGDPTGVTIMSVQNSSPTDGELDVSIDPSRLTVPHDFALDVVAGGVNSGTTDLHAVGVTNLKKACDPVAAANGSALLGQGPEGVAFDDIRNVAVVTNYSCNSVSIINMDLANLHNYGVPYGGVMSTFTVGAQPLGVAVIPRLGYAVTANNGGNGTTGTASIINISNPLAPTSATADVAVGLAPTGVGMDFDRALALVANTGSNTISAIDLTVLLPGAVTTTTPVSTPIAVGGPPNSIAVDPNRAIAVVTNLQNSGTSTAVGGLDVIALSTQPPTRSTSASINTLTANPTGIVYDPAPTTALFYATSTQQNAVYAFNPDTTATQLVRVGINPFSIAYNYQTGIMLTINSTSNTMSVVDTQTFTTQETLGISSQSQFSAAMDNFNNTAVIVDQNNNRVLLLAMPK
jgi:DNA-binding beta-propeller fold protein YncE